MKILNIKVLKGPNYWSNFRQKLIHLKLDIQQFEDYPTNLLENFTEQLITLMPSLANHYCSKGIEGGFIQRLEEGTWLGHVVEHVALELQYIAGMDCTFGRTRASNYKNVYHVIFAYEIEKAGIYAAKAAVDLVNCLARSKPYHDFNEVIQNLKKIQAQEGLGPSTKAIIKEAIQRNIPYHQVFSDSLMVLGQGVHQKKICAALTSQTSAIAVDLVCDKELTNKLLDSFHIPVPKGRIVKTRKQLNEAISKINFPLVIKPVNGNHGRGVTSNIYSEELAKVAFTEAKKISSRVVVEKFIEGNDYRFLVINYKLVAVAKRKPASIVGDGVSTIQQLIDKINETPNRGVGHENSLTKIKIDSSTLRILESKNFTLDSILSENEEIIIKDTANLSTGGTAIDVTDLVHPNNKYLAERIARLMHLDICGIDIIIKDIQLPLNEKNGAVIEVNAAPGLRMHLEFQNDNKRNVAKHILDLLYPEGTPNRIPVTAITGTNGKTTTVRLLAHFAMQAGFSVGYTTTDGIYHNKQLLRKGDCSGPISARSILQDPTINHAILECARGGILESGLGFDKCNISIITNITEDHLGLGDIESLEELARVKSVVAHSTFDDGYSILNADDDLVYLLKDELKCNIALFSLESNNPKIIEHCKIGGLAAYIENNYLIIKQGSVKKIVCNILELPLTFNGKARFMIQNILPAVLAGYLNQYEPAQMNRWLKQFCPSIENTPGRMNMFNLGHCKVLLDYGHNAAAMLEMKNYLQHIQCSKKIGIIASPGDRRNEDIENIGFYAAQIFDDIIIRHDEDGRGRTNQEITHLIKKGILKVNPNQEITIISDGKEALEYCLKIALNDSLITYFPENVFVAIEHLKSYEVNKEIFTGINDDA